MRINVNTATPAVLRILTPDILDEGRAASLAAGRGEEGYASEDDVLARPELAGQWEAAADMIAVRSEYFEVKRLEEHKEVSSHKFDDLNGALTYFVNIIMLIEGTVGNMKVGIRKVAA